MHQGTIYKDFFFVCLEIERAVFGEYMEHGEDKITFISKHPQSKFESLLLLTPCQSQNMLWVLLQATSFQYTSP